MAANDLGDGAGREERPCFDEHVHRVSAATRRYPLPDSFAASHSAARILEVRSIAL
jgi:hypothetical protein